MSASTEESDDEMDDAQEEIPPPHAQEEIPPPQAQEEEEPEIIESDIELDESDVVEPDTETPQKVWAIHLS